VLQKWVSSCSSTMSMRSGCRANSFTSLAALDEVLGLLVLQLHLFAHLLEADAERFLGQMNAPCLGGSALQRSRQSLIAVGCVVAEVPLLNALLHRPKSRWCSALVLSMGVPVTRSGTLRQLDPHVRRSSRSRHARRASRRALDRCASSTRLTMLSRSTGRDIHLWNDWRVVR